jgi:hypothetical protein
MPFTLFFFPLVPRPDRMVSSCEVGLPRRYAWKKTNERPGTKFLLAHSTYGSCSAGANQ